MPPILVGLVVAVIPLSLVVICMNEANKYARRRRRARHNKRERG
jgi:xanthine/uracil permease